MNISQDFVSAVEKNDLLMVRIMLKDSMVVDPTLAEFHTLLSFAEENMCDLYDAHDGESFTQNASQWTKDYMDEQMVKVVGNFSKERIELLKSICKHLYSRQVEKIIGERMEETEAKAPIARKHIGVGVTAAGVITAAVGIAISKPLVIGIGVAAAVAGGIFIATDK